MGSRKARARGTFLESLGLNRHLHEIRFWARSMPTSSIRTTRPDNRNKQSTETDRGRSALPRTERLPRKGNSPRSDTLGTSFGTKPEPASRRRYRRSKSGSRKLRPRLQDALLKRLFGRINQISARIRSQPQDADENTPCFAFESFNYKQNLSALDELTPREQSRRWFRSFKTWLISRPRSITRSSQNA